MKKASLLIVASAIVFSTTASAQVSQRKSQDDSGLYIGGALGAFGIGNDENNLKKGPSSTSKDGGGGKLFTGYQLTENFGVEIGGMRSNTLKRTFIVDARNVEQKGKVEAIYLAATGRLPLGEHFALNARLGVARGKFSGTNVLPASSTIIGAKTGALIGGGGEYRFTPKISATLDFDYLPDISSRTRALMFSAGVKFLF
jgi:OmpA-OmpF porin, OOP family